MDYVVIRAVTGEVIIGEVYKYHEDYIELLRPHSITPGSEGKPMGLTPSIPQTPSKPVRLYNNVIFMHGPAPDNIESAYRTAISGIVAPPPGFKSSKLR